MKTLKSSLAMIVFLFSGAVTADFRNSDFVKFTDGEKHWWYAGAIETLGHMVFLHDEEKAQCVWKWLPTETEKKKALLDKSFKQYPDHAPTAILLALVQRDCGELLPAHLKK